MSEEMFCFQCQEACGNTGCTVRGVCGKTAETAKYIIKRISLAAIWIPLVSIRISLISIRSALSAAAIAVLAVAFCLLLHYLLICLLYLFEFFFSRFRIVQIRIRMILPAQSFICFFYFFF